MDIVKTHFGAYGVGGRIRLHHGDGLPATKFAEYMVPRRSRTQINESGGQASPCLHNPILVTEGDSMSVDTILHNAKITTNGVRPSWKQSR